MWSVPCPVLSNRTVNMSAITSVFYGVRDEGLQRRVKVVCSQYTRVEAGSNTSTVTLRVVGGVEKGSLKSDTVKYGLESQGARTRERLRWQGPAAYTKYRPVLSSEKVPHKNNTITVKQ
jgi:hypothetical protein